MTSGEMFAAGPIAQQSKVVAFGTGTTAPKITDIGDYISVMRFPANWQFLLPLKSTGEVRI